MILLLRILSANNNITLSIAYVWINNYHFLFLLDLDASYELFKSLSEKVPQYLRLKL